MGGVGAFYIYMSDQRLDNFMVYSDVLLTVHRSIFISVFNQLDEQNFCFTISLFHACTCFEHMWSKHVEAWNKTYCETNFVHQVG